MNQNPMSSLLDQLVSMAASPRREKEQEVVLMEKTPLPASRLDVQESDHKSLSPAQMVTPSSLLSRAQ